MSRLRILWGSPLPPLRSGVSDYATELLEVLAEMADLRVLKPPGVDSLDGWPIADRVEIVASDAPPREGEIPVYHLGNNPHHDWLLERVNRDRAVAVLHDYVLHHVLVESTVARGNFQVFKEHLVAAHGDDGRQIAEARRLGLNGALDPFRFPATSSLVARARGLVVHSDWVRRRIGAELSATPIAEIPLPVRDPGTVDRKAARARWGLPEDELVLMHLGFITMEKGLDSVLGAVAAATRLGVSLRLVVVGEGGLMPLFEAAIASLGLRDRVLLTGYVEPEAFFELPAAADIGVVLRRPSAGETSAAVLRFLACGTPVAVMGHHQFLEWPEEIAPRVTPGLSSLADFTRVLVEAWDGLHSGSWAQYRPHARAVYESRHRPQDSAKALIEFLSRL